MRSFFALLFPLALAFGAPAHAQAWTEVAIEEWTEDGADRLVEAAPVAHHTGLAAYGPFRVLGPTRAALVGPTDGRSPGAFKAMLRAWPALATLEMVDCPGTDDDTANLALGRLIRAAGLATHVPAGGSVRSGAVELFLAGRTRQIEDGAEFAVHAWRDSDGREAGDYPLDSPWNRAYLDYYVEMGMAQADARAFYAMTNAVPNAAARWLTAQDMRVWLRDGRAGDIILPAAASPAAAPTIAYLDLGPRFP